MLSHDFFQRFIKSPSRREGMSMPTYSWLLDFLADGNKEPSPLRRSEVDGGLWGSRSHLCNRFMVKCYTNAYKGFSLFLFPAPSFVSLSFARLCLPCSPIFFLHFLAVSSLLVCIAKYIGISKHPLVVANPLAAIGICELPFASYRSLKPNKHFGQ